MIQKIKTTMMVLATAFLFAVPVVVASSSTASAACTGIANKISEGASKSAGGTDTTCTATGVNDDSVTSAANKIVNTFSLIVGIVAVIMIIVGGFRYITSGGDSGKVGNAKNSLVYAIVGLVVVALAQVIVHFVVNQTGSLTT